VIRDASDGTNAIAIAEEEHLGAWRLVAGPDPAGHPNAFVLRKRDQRAETLRRRRFDALSQGWD
jgi:hypothetical protein